MAFIPAENTAKVEIRMTQDGQKVENTLYFRHDTGAISSAEREALGNWIEAWWNDEIRPLQTNEVTFREVYVTDMSSAMSGTSSVSDLNGTPGAQGTPSEPNNVTVTISFRTDFRGRSARGRNYAIGLTTADVTANQVAQVTLDAWVDAYELLLTLPGLDNWTWVVASFYTNNAPRVEALLLPVTDVLVVDDVVDSQRRRLPGRGD